MDWSAIALSLRLATATTLILLAVGLPLAGWLALSHRRGRWAVDALVALPLVLPPTVLGFYVLVALGPRSPIGRAYEAITGARCLFVSRAAGRVGPVQPAVRRSAVRGSVRRRRSQSDRNGVVSRRIASADIRAYRGPAGSARYRRGRGLELRAHVGEFGVVLMVGGNLPGRPARSRSRFTTTCRRSITRGPDERRRSCSRSRSSCWP